MNRKPTRIDRFTKQTTGDYVFTAIFWTVVLGWPLFVVIYRWLH